MSRKCSTWQQINRAKIDDILIKVGADLKNDNIYEFELTNVSRVLALPSTDDLGIPGAEEASPFSWDLPVPSTGTYMSARGKSRVSPPGSLQISVTIPA
jgi:hypothetical protein